MSRSNRIAPWPVEQEARKVVMSAVGSHKPIWKGGSALALLAFAGLVEACSSASAAPAVTRPVTAASPPKDDGKASKGGAGGTDHSAALEQLKTSPTGQRADKQRSVLVPLPDAEHWTRVRFLTVPSLVGFRYGKEHYAIVGAFITHVDDNTVDGACSKSVEAWAKPMLEAFDVELNHEPPSAFSWSTIEAPRAKDAPRTPRAIAIVEVDPLIAKTATILSRETYAAAWAAYPAWDKACLAVGVGVPFRTDEARAKEVRDRFVRDVFPKVTVTTPTEPKERY